MSMPRHLYPCLSSMLYHLAPHGSLALLLANGSMSSNIKGEGKIRRALVECMLALPGRTKLSNN